jgi:uncharacterized protein involved in exopolysaccharide biosynthesis
MFPAALAVPKLRAEFEALYRDRKVSEATLIFALERLESAHADAARDTSTFLVMDPPTLPTRHVRPKKSIILIQAFFLGLAAAVALELWRGRQRGAAKAEAKPAELTPVRGPVRAASDELV